MQDKPVTLFYLFFQGAMLFQVIFFGMVFLITKRRDVLYYSLLNLVSACYFFLNAPDTFFGIVESIVFNSATYLYVNFALFMLMMLMYLVFLKEIFSETVNKYKYVRNTYAITLFIIPLLYLLFVLFGLLGWKTNPVFYCGHLVNGPFCTLIILLNFKKRGYQSLIINGMIVVFIAVVTTMILTVRYNAGSNDTILDRYPLLIIKISMLIDILLFQLALLKRWNEQEKQLAVEKLQSQLAVEKLRNKISGELHDDIGSTLSGIAMYSHMTQSQLKNADYDNAKESINVIQRSANEIVDKLGDLVWTINPVKDSFYMMLDRIQQYGEEMCRPKNIRFEYAVDKTDLVKDTGMDIRQHLYLFAKEAINNAVKYSDATVVRFQSSFINNTLDIVIADNGNGFDMDTVTKGNGLNNMQQRASKIGAKYLLKSKAGNGASVSLSLKIPQ